VNELAPSDRRLADQIRLHQRDRKHANDRHLMFELSAIGFQVGIVLAGVSILVRRRWLLAGSAIVGLAGLVVLLTGLLIWARLPDASGGLNGPKAMGTTSPRRLASGRRRTWTRSTPVAGQVG
jgi:Flp pilus assembly protein TadB